MLEIDLVKLDLKKQKSTKTLETIPETHLQILQESDDSMSKKKILLSRNEWKIIAAHHC